MAIPMMPKGVEHSSNYSPFQYQVAPKKKLPFVEEEQDLSTLLPPQEDSLAFDFQAPETPQLIAPPPEADLLNFGALSPQTLQSPDLEPELEAIAPEGGSEAIPSPPNPIVEGGRARRVESLAPEIEIDTTAKDIAAKDFHEFNKSIPNQVPTQGSPKPGPANPILSTPNLVTPPPTPANPTLPSQLVGALKGPQNADMPTANTTAMPIPGVTGPSIPRPTSLPQLASPNLEQVAKAKERAEYENSRDFLDIPEIVAQDPERLRQYVLAEIGSGRVGSLQGRAPLYTDQRWKGAFSLHKGTNILPTNYETGTDSMNQAAADNETYRATNNGLNLFGLKRSTGEDLSPQEYAQALEARRDPLDGRIRLPIPKADVERIYNQIATMRPPRGGGQLTEQPIIEGDAPRTNQMIGVARGVADELQTAGAAGIDLADKALNLLVPFFGSVDEFAKFAKNDPDYQGASALTALRDIDRSTPTVIPRSAGEVSRGSSQADYDRLKGYGSTAGSVATYVGMGATGPIAAPLLATQYGAYRRKQEQRANQDIVDAYESNTPFTPEQAWRVGVNAQGDPNDPLAYEVLQTHKEYSGAGQALGLSPELSRSLATTLSPWGRGLKEGGVFLVQPYVESVLIGALKPLKDAIASTKFIPEAQLISAATKKALLATDKSGRLVNMPLNSLTRYIQPLATSASLATVARQYLAKANPTLAAVLSNATGKATRAFSFPISNMVIATATGGDYTLDQFKHDFTVGIFLQGFHALKLTRAKVDPRDPESERLGVLGAAKSFFKPENVPTEYYDDPFSTAGRPMENRTITGRQDIDVLIDIADTPDFLESLDLDIRRKYVDPNTPKEDLDLYDYALDKIYDKQQALKQGQVEPLDTQVDKLMTEAVEEIQTQAPEAFGPPAPTAPTLKTPEPSPLAGLLDQVNQVRAKFPLSAPEMQREQLPELVAPTEPTVKPESIAPILKAPEPSEVLQGREVVKPGVPRNSEEVYRQEVKRLASLGMSPAEIVAELNEGYGDHPLDIFTPENETIPQVKQGKTPRRYPQLDLVGEIQKRREEVVNRLLGEGTTSTLKAPTELAPVEAPLPESALKAPEVVEPKAPEPALKAPEPVTPTLAAPPEVKPEAPPVKAAKPRKAATTLPKATVVKQVAPRVETTTQDPDRGLEIIDSTDEQGKNPQRIARLTMSDGTKVEYAANSNKTPDEVRQDGFKEYQTQAMRKLSNDYRQSVDAAVAQFKANPVEGVDIDDITDALDSKYERDTKTERKRILGEIANTVRTGDPETVIEATADVPSAFGSKPYPAGTKFRIEPIQAEKGLGFRTEYQRPGDTLWTPMYPAKGGSPEFRSYEEGIESLAELAYYNTPLDNMSTTGKAIEAALKSVTAKKGAAAPAFPSEPTPTLKPPPGSIGKFKNDVVGETVAQAKARLARERKGAPKMLSDLTLGLYGYMDRMFSNDTSPEAVGQRKFFEQTQNKVLDMARSVGKALKTVLGGGYDMTQETLASERQTLMRNLSKLELQPERGARIYEAKIMAKRAELDGLRSDSDQVRELEKIVINAKREDGRSYHDVDDRSLLLTDESSSALKTLFPSRLPKLTGISRKLFDGLHAFNGTNQDGSIIWNDSGVVWDHLEVPTNRSWRQVIADRYKQYDKDWKIEHPDEAPPPWNPEMFEAVKDPYSNKNEYRVWMKWQPDENKDLFAQAVTGGDAQKFSETTLGGGDKKPNDDLMKVLLGMKDIYNNLAKVEGIDPIPGYAHHMMDDANPATAAKRNYQPKLKYATAETRFHRTGTLWRQGLVKRDAFAAIEKALNATTKENVHNDFLNVVAKEVQQSQMDSSKIAKFGNQPGGTINYDKWANMADTSTNFGNKLSRFKTPEAKANFLQNFGFDEATIANLSNEGQDSAKNGVFFPHVVLDLLGSELRENTGGFLDNYVMQSEGRAGEAARMLNAFLHDLTNIGVLAKLQKPSSGTRDLLSGVVNNAMYAYEESIANAMRIERGEMDASSFIRPYQRMFESGGRMLKRGVTTPLAFARGQERNDPKYLQESALPDSYYRGLEDSETGILKYPLKFAGLLAKPKGFFDVVGKRLAADTVAQVEADRYIEQVKRGTPGGQPGIRDVAILRDMREQFLNDPPPQTLARVRMAVNEYQFGGEGINPYALAAVDNIAVKNLITPFPKFALKLGALLNQRLNPLAARNLYALMLKTKPSEVEISETELAGKGLDTNSINAKLINMDRVFRRYARVEIEDMVASVSNADISDQLRFLDRSKRLKLMQLGAERDPERVQHYRNQISSEIAELKKERDTLSQSPISHQQQMDRFQEINKRIDDFENYLMKGADPFAFREGIGLADAEREAKLDTPGLLKAEDKRFSALKKNTESVGDYSVSKIKRLQRDIDYLQKIKAAHATSDSFETPELARTPEELRDIDEDLADLIAERDRTTTKYQDAGTLKEREDMRESVRKFLSIERDNFIKDYFDKLRADIENPKVEMRDINKRAVQLRKELRLYLKQQAVPTEMIDASRAYLLDKQADFIKETQESAAKFNQNERDQAVARYASGGLAGLGYLLTQALGINAINPNPVTDEKGKRAFTPGKQNIDMAVPLRGLWLDKYIRAGGISPIPEALGRFQFAESLLKSLINLLPDSSGLGDLPTSTSIDAKHLITQQVGQGQLGAFLLKAYDSQLGNKEQNLGEVAADTLISSTPGTAYAQEIRNQLDTSKRKTTGFFDKLQNITPWSSDLPVKPDMQTGYPQPSTGSSVIGKLSPTGGYFPTADKVIQGALRLTSPVDIIDVNQDEKDLYSEPGMRADQTTPEALNTYLSEQNRHISKEANIKLAQEVSKQQVARQSLRFETLRAIEKGGVPPASAGVQLDTAYLNRIYKSLSAEGQEKMKKTFASGDWYDMKSIVRDTINEGLKTRYPNLKDNPDEHFRTGTLPSIPRENPEKRKYNANAEALKIFVSENLKRHPEYRNLSGNSEQGTGFKSLADKATEMVMNKFKIKDNVTAPDKIKEAAREIDQEIANIAKSQPGASFQDNLINEILIAIKEAQADEQAAFLKRKAEEQEFRTLKAPGESFKRGSVPSDALNYLKNQNEDKSYQQQQQQLKPPPTLQPYSGDPGDL